MERLVFDSSAYLPLRTGHPAVIEAVASAAVVLIPSLVLGELQAIFRLGSRREDNVRVLDEFLGEPHVSVVDVTAVTARFYGDIFTALRRGGTLIPLNDVWIAAVTFESGGHLLTFDRHFEHVTGLQYTLLADSR